jgi:hypothetical protein
VVFERVRRCVTHGIEQNEHPVGLIDLATTPLGNQIARHAVVRRPQGRRLSFFESFGQPRAIDDVGQQQGMKGGHGRWVLRA